MKNFKLLSIIQKLKIEYINSYLFYSFKHIYKLKMNTSVFNKSAERDLSDQKNVPVVRIVCIDDKSLAPTLYIKDTNADINTDISTDIISSIASNNNTIGLTPMVYNEVNSDIQDTNKTKIRGFMKMFPYNNRQFGSYPIQNINYKYQINQVYEVFNNSQPLDRNNSFTFGETMIDLDAIDIYNKFSVYVLIEAIGNISYKNYNYMFTEAYTDKIKIIKIITRNDILKMFSDGTFISSVGDIFNFKHNKLHSENDCPAIIRINGSKYWYNEGLLHRSNDLPAIEFKNEIQIWYYNGYIHRSDDLPAYVSNKGISKWYKYGNLHRENNLPAIINPTNISYFLDGHYYNYEPRNIINTSKTVDINTSKTVDINTSKTDDINTNKTVDINNRCCIPYIFTGFLLTCVIISYLKKR